MARRGPRRAAAGGGAQSHLDGDKSRWWCSGAHRPADPVRRPCKHTEGRKASLGPPLLLSSLPRDAITAVCTRSGRITTPPDRPQGRLRRAGTGKNGHADGSHRVASRRTLLNWTRDTGCQQFRNRILVCHRNNMHPTRWTCWHPRCRAPGSCRRCRCRRQRATALGGGRRTQASSPSAAGVPPRPCQRPARDTLRTPRRCTSSRAWARHPAFAIGHSSRPRVRHSHHPRRRGRAAALSGGIQRQRCLLQNAHRRPTRHRQHARTPSPHSGTCCHYRRHYVAVISLEPFVVTVSPLAQVAALEGANDPQLVARRLNVVTGAVSTLLGAAGRLPRATAAAVVVGGREYGGDEEQSCRAAPPPPGSCARSARG